MRRDSQLPLAKAASRVDVPWFPLPVSNNPQSRDIASISEIAADGSLGQAADFLQHCGASVNPERQNGPHAHAIICSPDNEGMPLSC